ncbi:serine hydrolase domain-containing protein [uncultured Sphingomonas sp.]|uniref:serine hydrolase domain-containing protein n=1 Tax=uncultured Sphingomonas sp. TaxID=158754 RepID=UPI0035CA4407
MTHPARLIMSALLGMLGSTAGADAPAPVEPVLPPALARQVDGAIRQVLAEDGTPSASVAIVRQGRIVYARAFGLASSVPRRSASVDTRYQLASASKSITAQTLLLLAADGTLSLDAPVSRWLPQVTDAGHITVRELLEHVSGLPDHYPQTYPAGPRSALTTPDRIIAQWGSHPLLFAPGARFRYSNLNYVMAGRIAELASGKPLFALQQRRIFRPLGMADVIDLDHVTPNTPNVATGYVRTGLGPLEPAPDEGPGWSFGAGQIVATASDLARWDIALLSGKLLPDRQAREEVTPPLLLSGDRSPYALGLFVSRKSGRLVWSHVGQGLGFLAGNSIYPDDDTAIVVLTNTSATVSFAHIADRLAFLLLPPTSVDARARRLFAQLQGGAPDRALLTPEFSAFLDAHRLGTYTASLGPLGSFDSFVLKSEDEADGITTRRYEASAGGKRLSIIWEELADGRTDDFAIQPAVE